MGAGGVVSAGKRKQILLDFDDGSTKTVYLGAFSQIAAKRAVGLDALRSGDPEAILYGAWVELHGVPKRETAAAEFDKWLKSIADFGLAEQDDDDEDPPVAESSGSSLESPPTSD